MKDTTIPASRKKKEWIIFMLSFLVAFFMNVYAILRYQRPVTELFTQLHVVLLLTIIVYALVAFLRLIWWTFTKLYKSLIKN